MPVDNEHLISTQVSAIGFKISIIDDINKGQKKKKKSPSTSNSVNRIWIH